jgi:hypothetical protein
LAADAIGAQALSLVALEPAVVKPYEGFTLVLSGSGFEPGTSVRIEGGTEGRYLSYEPSALTPESCEVRLALGFGPRPTSRRVYLEGADGGRSETLVLSIGAPQTVVEETVDAKPQEETTTDAEPPPTPTDAMESESVPELLELRPSPIAAGQVTVLEIYGENFTEDSVVWVSVNVNAGSTRLPQYELKAFETLFVDSGLLEVQFDRGFYPVPGARDIVVENPGGGRSMPAVLMIEREN